MPGQYYWIESWNVFCGPARRSNASTLCTNLSGDHHSLGRQRSPGRGNYGLGNHQVIDTISGTQPHLILTESSIACVNRHNRINRKAVYQ
jgi:hypothetical protein